MNIRNKILLLIILVFSLWGQPVIGMGMEMPEVAVSENAELLQDGYLSTQEESLSRFVLLSDEKKNQAKEAIIQAVNNLEIEVDLKSFEIPRTELLGIYQEVFNTHPEFFYVSGKYTYYYNTNTELVTRLILGYEYAPQEIMVKKEAYEKVIEDILKNVEEDMTEVEKMLAVHDAIVLSAAYDTERLEDGNFPRESYTSYGILVNGVGVCQGYALGFLEIMNQLKIEGKIVTSLAMNHAWNIVKNEGSWYHLDVTWDDPLTNNRDVLGRVSHKNFLLSDKEIGKNHYQWNSDAPFGESTQYDHFFWRNVGSAMYYDHKNWYFIENNFYSNLIDGTGKIKLNEEGSFSYLSVLGRYENFWIYTKGLYNENKDCIFIADVDGKNERVLVKEEEMVYGILIIEDQLIYDLQNENGEIERRDYDLGVLYENVLGDVDRNKFIEAYDALLTLQIATGKKEGTTKEIIAADVDKKDGVQAYDALRILQFATGKITEF